MQSAIFNLPVKQSNPYNSRMLINIYSPNLLAAISREI